MKNKKNKLLLIVFIIIILILILAFLIKNILSDKVYYRTYSEKYGWTSWVKNGKESGFEDADILKIQIKIEKHLGHKGEVFYKTYFNKDFQYDYICCGKSNSKGKYKVEAIKIMLSDDLYNNYDINYRTYSKKYGWLKYTKNEGISGVKNEGIQKIQININKKGKSIKDNSNNESSIGF